ncbi:hypothetical protein ENUP19_0159G0012 [Entamoeba nuttalli]|uniref:Uncharacterized protein n=1 Tax=Entamoeba nuttalli TaxID=412467 RepID=A0ABQ0DD38_9EUKA
MRRRIESQSQKEFQEDINNKKTNENSELINNFRKQLKSLESISSIHSVEYIIGYTKSEVKVLLTNEQIIQLKIEIIDTYYSQKTSPVFSESTIDLILILYYLTNKNNLMFIDETIKINGLASTYSVYNVKILV